VCGVAALVLDGLRPRPPATGTLVDRPDARTDAAVPVQEVPVRDGHDHVAGP
jgi:hypothetical protein